MAKSWLDAMPEVFLSTTERSSAVSRATSAGLLRRIGSKLYTRNLIDPPEQIVRRHLWRLVAAHVPGALIADRTALENMPASDGSIFVVAGRVRDIELPGITIRARKGPPPQPEDRPFIGGLFIDVFWDAVGDAEMLAQGTLYPDVIESASNAKSKASVIKTHHNRVERVLELQAQGKVLEPLAELFKDEVRELGASMGIPHDILWRHPFPGPGLAVRCPGVVTKERLDIIRECDAIFIGNLKKYGWYDKVWQAYAGLIPVKTVGVKGDERSYEWATNLRAIVSEDAMTADWVELPPALLRETSNRILNEVKGINRVLYDISTKPPASIEWE